MKSYQIIATLGPASENRILQLIKAGATGFRINSSHLSLQDLTKYLMKLEHIFQQRGDSLPVWIDLQGTKLRLGLLQKPRKLAMDQQLKLALEYQEKADEIPLPHPEAFELLAAGDRILIDDGKLELKVVEKQEGMILSVVVRGGILQSFKGVTIVNKIPQFKQVSNRDKAIIKETKSLKFLGYAISYLQNAKETQLFRDLMGGKPLTAKIERQDALSNLVEISTIANVTWLCRGDLGTNANIFDLYRHEKHFAEIMSLTRKPYLIAGQVLEHMTQNPSPTRSEIAHLGFLHELGFSGVVLSDETAIGKYPVETVKFCKDLFEYLHTE